MNAPMTATAPRSADRLAEQIAWADANGYTAMAALGVWTHIIGLVWRALDTDAGADAIERVRGERPGRDRPAQHLIVETQAIRIAGALRLVDDADIGALTRAHTSVMNAGRRRLPPRPQGHAARRRHASRVRGEGRRGRGTPEREKMLARRHQNPSPERPGPAAVHQHRVDEGTHTRGSLSVKRVQERWLEQREAHPWAKNVPQTVWPTRRLSLRVRSQEDVTVCSSTRRRARVPKE